MKEFEGRGGRLAWRELLGTPGSWEERRQRMQLGHGCYCLMTCPRASGLGCVGAERGLRVGEDILHPFR